MKNLLYLLCILCILSCRQEKIAQIDITAAPAIMCMPQLTDANWYTSNTPAPLFAGMDVLHYPITTSDPEAQKYFNQGLLFAYGFNHAEAARSFYHATRLDSTCVMCYWGYAYVLGPNYNAGMEPDNYSRAFDAIQKALKVSDSSTPKEKDLIQAMAARYVKEPVDNRYVLDSAYMLEMKELHQKYPDDVDIAAMYAESLMDMHPWDLWETNGQPKAWTPDILAAIENAIRLNPKHPGGHHFYIHAVEASPEPQKAFVSCKVFDDGLVPASGHLVHMPSHIYINTGDYHKGTVANINALKLDSNYVTQCHAQGAYPLVYYPHNYHFLAACATLEGNSQWALHAAHKMSDQTNHKGMLLAPLVTLQHFYSIPYFVQVKFAKWNEILSEGPPDTVLLYPTGIYHYAKGMAHVGLNQLDKAQAELDALNLIEQQDTLKKMKIWEINSTHHIIQIAQKVLAGELASKKGNYDESIRLLREAIAIEDQLAYQEPPDWFFSVRHHLGAVLLDAKKADEAIKVYEEDLITFPKNGWALSGLKKAYAATKHAEKWMP
ncbi:MAG: hypothetical protein ABIQ11_11040 [Saprospiraceae bacterium]